ncbi:primosomal protein N' [Peptoniphilus mikwangii]|uniref:primosomal protein N' n=1 Tax=Peptoniphilus mikwangii TaxID=1354300 RepID=UPI000428BA6D|nr:primosomal protein N' [Peptoniphilus mikwangii]
MKYASVFIQNSVSKIDDLYLYKCPENLFIEIGMRVIVPFGRGNSTRIALVVKIHDNIEKVNYKLKTIINVIDYEPILEKDLIELGFWMSDRYLTTYSQSFSPIFPPGDVKKIKKIAKINGNIKLNDSQNEFIRLIEKNNYELDFLDGDEKLKNFLRVLIEKKVIEIDFKIDTIGGEKTQKYVKLSKNYLRKIGEKSLKITEKQSLIIKYLQEKIETSRANLLSDLKLSDAPLKSLVNKEIVELYDKFIERNPYKDKQKLESKILNDEQLKVLNGIFNSNKETDLIYGLTGSGKTEIYLKLAEEVIKAGGQVIVLVPEIGLTPQMIERFMGRFENKVSVLHSKLSTGERYDQWQKIKNGYVDVVVGARSAIFAPFKNLKLVIIDEEHDSSYRFHNALRYDTLEVAQKRMNILNGKVIIGSATPSIDSYYNALSGKYGLFKLKHRAVLGAKLPTVQIVDMRKELLRGNVSIFSEQLRNLIEEKLEKKEQIILFLNRRGFSNFVSCRSCGHVIKCDNCDISMTYHKNTNSLRCHYCGSTKKMVDRCHECGSKFIKQFGVGTQKVEEEVQKLFPNARIIRMDRDTTVRKNSYDNIYESVKNKEVDILIGTQMLAKGLDFENVTLVGIIAADLSLYISDYKATETTFELLTQVSGRAGRSNKGGDVIIQTYEPDNYSIVYSKNADYERFYNKEIGYRKEFNYPPFIKLVNIHLYSEFENKLDFMANEILNSFAGEIRGYKVEHTRIIKMPKIKNVFNRKITLKVDPDNLEELIEVIKRVLINNRLKLNKNNIFIEIEFI